MIVRGWVANDVHPPTFGAASRTFGLMRGLARHGEASLTCVVGSRHRAPGVERVHGVRLRRVKPYHPTLFHYLERVGVASSYWSHGVYERWPGPLLEPDDRRAQIWQVDSLVLCGLFRHAPAGALKVYASQNVEAEWFERVGPPVAASRHWARRIEALERRAVDESDLVVAVSQSDRDGFAGRYGAADDKLVVVENGFDADALRPPTAEERAAARRELGVGDERVWLFTGSDYPHNRLAVEHLLAHVVPALEQHDAVLLLVGGVSAPYAARAGGRLRCFPARAELRPLLWAADCGLNPITTGAGSNVKVPTYLGAGLATVSTPFGLRGYERLARFVRQAPVEDFAAAAAVAGYDGAVAEALAGYRWSALADRLADEYRRRLDAGAGRSRCAS